MKRYLFNNFSFFIIILYFSLLVGFYLNENSTGGAINVITAAPSTDSAFGSADLTLGDYDFRKFRASFNLPLGEDLALRASMLTNKRDGFTENLSLGQDLDLSLIHI